MTSRPLPRRIFALSFVIALALAFIACESKSETSTGPSPLKCQVSLEAPPDSIAPDGGKSAVTVSAQPHLDGRYTVFGQVIAGMDVVDRLQQWDRMARIRVWDGVSGIGF